MTSTVSNKRLIAASVSLALLLPLSAIAESRAPQRTDLQEMVRELEAVLGRDSVSTQRRRSQRTSRSGYPVTEERIRRTAGQLNAEEVLGAMNEQRAKHGLRPLRSDALLARAASDRMNDMFTRRYFDHVSPSGTQPHVWVDRRGYDYALFGENLAAGYTDARAVVDGWMRSPGHRANILGNFAEVGLSIAPGAPVSRYRGGYTIVALYARPA